MSFIHIYVPAGYILGYGADIGRYVLQLIDMNRESNLSLIDVIAQCKKDYYQPIITYLVSRISSEGHVLYLFFGFIYGFFYSRNIWYILERLPLRFPKPIFILIALFFLICPIWNVGGVRMWTALHVFLYGALPYLLNEDRSKIIIAIFSIFIHFSFIMPVVVFLLYLFIPESLKTSKNIFITFLFFYLASSLLEFLSVDAIGNILYNIAPDIFEENVEGYLGDEYIAKIQLLSQNKSIFYKLSSSILKYGFGCLIIISSFIVLQNDNKLQKNILRLFSFGLLLYSIANILSIVPTGSRFITLARMFVLPAIILIFSYYGYRKYSVLTNIVLISLLAVVVMCIRTGAECYGINLLLGNFMTAIPMETNISFIAALRNVF